MAVFIVLMPVAAYALDPDYNEGDGSISIDPYDPGDPGDWGNDPDIYDPDDTSTDTDAETEDAVNNGPCGPNTVLIEPGMCYGGGYPGPPRGGTPTPIVVDPGDVAESVLDKLQLTTPNVHTAPSGSPGSPALVNLPTWLWIDSTNWRTLTKSATAGATTVVVTAVPVSVSWDMGEGRTSCSGPGTAWVGGDQIESPSGCDYTYTSTSRDQTNGRYKVATTIMYQATWHCTGFCLADSGDLGVVGGPTTAASIGVEERQSVVIQ